MIRMQNLSLPCDFPESRLSERVASQLHLKPSDLQKIVIRRKSIDARKKDDIRRIYTVDVQLPDEAGYLRKNRSRAVSKAPEYHYSIPKATAFERPLIVGFGPAGMFAALILAEAGLRPIVFERGEPVADRKKSVARFWSEGRLNPESNVQFGAGGAGTFSDGKLSTGTHDARIPWILETFVRFGAPPDICYDAMPHIGTDILTGIVTETEQKITALGGEVRYSSRLEDLMVNGNTLCGIVVNGTEIPCHSVILAPGHSARDTLEMLHRNGVRMTQKAFSMGVRIEHPRKWIDTAQYGASASLLPAATYQLSSHFPDGSSAYTFCMCPGGSVVCASSEAGGIVTNGMSYHARDLENSNSALLVTLKPEDFPSADILSGMYWQRELEQKAYRLAGMSYLAPAQRVGDFLTGRETLRFETVRPSCLGGVFPTELHRFLPKKITDVLERAIPDMARKLRGFDLPDAVLTGPETRSSSPVRILRDSDYQSSLRGFLPCGEGAGYAGGIVSAAADGIRSAEKWIAQYATT